MTVNPLANVPLFSDFPPDELDHLLSVLDTVSLKSGEILFHDGDPSDRMYVVVSGVLEILRAASEDGESILSTLDEGNYLGQMSLIVPDNYRTASARARGNVVLLSMSRDQFIELLQRNPLLAYAALNVLGHQMSDSYLATYQDLTEKSRQLQQVSTEKEFLEQELKVAADIQMSILPDVLPTHDKFDFGGRILPARQVGGDFYDVFDLDDNRIGVLIGDVADKGVPSAIFMARVHALIIAEADSVTQPGEVLCRVNKHITHLEKSTQFVTALYGVLDTETGEFSYARAGHELPFLLNPQGEIQRLPHRLGMALGLRDDIVLDEYTIFLPKGSLLVMFTDGMTDCRNPKGERFGLELIKTTMIDLNDKSAQTGCDQLFDTLMKYQNGSKQDDDVTLVAIHAK